MATAIQLVLIIGKLLLVNGLDESFANWAETLQGPGIISNELVQQYETFVKNIVFGSLIDHLAVVPFSHAFKDFSWCYDFYPCFQIGGPFISTFRPVSLPPYPPSVIGVEMELFTRRNPDKPFAILSNLTRITNFSSFLKNVAGRFCNQFLFIQNELFKIDYSSQTYGLNMVTNLITKDRVIVGQVFKDLNNIRRSDVGLSNFNSAAETKFVIGGFLDGNGRTAAADLIPALLAHSDCNVFNVNWFKGSLTTYSQAVANTRMVGAVLGRFIEIIHNETELPLERCHILGHSLGSHIAGYAGEHLKRFSLKLGRISGLDPAGPFFENADPVVRLDVTDAKFVDVMKTNKGTILTGYFGIDQKIGHVDVNPNGGRHQPSCSVPNFNLLSIASNVSLLNSVCSHLAAPSLYAETIPAEGAVTTCHFTAFPCTTYELYKLSLCFKSGKPVEMGYNSILYTDSNSVPAPSEFYLDTNNASPFCKNVH